MATGLVSTMTKLLGWRIWGGVAVAVLAAVLVSFIAGCFFSVVLAYPDIEEMPKLKEFMEAFILVGGVAAIVAGVISVPSLLLIGLPLYLVSIRQRKVSIHIYVLGGFVTSLVFCLILTAFHVLSEFLLSEDYYFAVISMLIAGPVTTSVFWVFVRPDRLAC